MDTTLKVLKRVGRAILQPELRAARAASRAAFNLQIETACALRVMREEKDKAWQEAEKARAEVRLLKSRIVKVHEWGQKNRSGDLGWKCCTEFLALGTAPLQPGMGGLYLSPFDRWQVSPKLSD